MSDSSVPRLRITSPAEFTQVIPYLVGFTPEESLVVTVVDQGMVVVTARVDLPDIQQPGQAELLLDRMWARFPDAQAYLVAYTADPTAGWTLLQRCADHLPPGATRQTMLVDGDTWHLPDGQSGAADRYGTLAAEASFHGLQRLPSRTELAASFTSPPDTPELAATLDAAFDTLPHAGDTDAIVARMGDLLRHNLPTAADGTPQPMMDGGEAAQLAILARHGQAREVALLSVTRDNARDHLALWRTVVTHVPDYAAEAPLFLAGMAAWAAGEGAMASIALERAEQIGHPHRYPPARLLGQLIDQVVPPTAWDDLRREGLAIADPQVRHAVAGVRPPTLWETVHQHPLQHPHQPPDIPPPTPRIAI